MLLDIILKGSTSRSISLAAVDNSTGLPVSVAYNAAGLSLWYRRPGAAQVAITPVTLAALTTAWTSGGWLVVANGEHRLDIPDAALASGVEYVDVGGTATGVTIVGGRIRLTSINLDDSVRAGLTAMPNAAAGANGGLPVGDSTGSVKIQHPFKTGTMVNNFEFLVTYDSTHPTTPHAPATGKTVTVYKDVDGANSWTSLGTATETANGYYQIDVPLSGAVVAIRWSASGCDDGGASFPVVP